MGSEAGNEIESPYFESKAMKMMRNSKTAALDLLRLQTDDRRGKALETASLCKRYPLHLSICSWFWFLFLRAK